MRIRPLKLKRRAILAAGALAVGVLGGCQMPGQQFAQPGVARGDTGAVSPAFAQVNAGQRMAQQTAMAGQMSMPMNSGMTMMQPSMTAMQPQMMASGQQMMGSGGMVHPVAYSASGPIMMQPGSVTTPMPVMYPQQGMVSPVTPMQTGTVQSMPVSGGQPTYVLVNGPNGPQYMLVEMMPQNIPASAPTPTVATPVMMPSSPATLPVGAPVHAVPAGTIPAPEPAPPAPPTFAAPPAPVSAPAAPAPAAVKPASSVSMDPAPRVPDPLPTSVSSKPPAGPSLPAAEAPAPSLGSFPAPPAPMASSAPKLPPASNGFADDDIPPAPVFLPAAR
jgi:hypothetical protein